MPSLTAFPDTVSLEIGYGSPNQKSIRRCKYVVAEPGVTREQPSNASLEAGARPDDDGASIGLAPVPRTDWPVAAPGQTSSASLEIVVLHTEPEETLSALKMAAELASGLARVRLLAVQVVPYPLSLNAPPVSTEFLENQSLEEWLPTRRWMPPWIFASAAMRGDALESGFRSALRGRDRRAAQLVADRYHAPGAALGAPGTSGCVCEWQVYEVRPGG